MEIIDVRVRPHTPFFNRNIWPNPTPVMKFYLERYHHGIFDDFPLVSLEESTRLMLKMGTTRAVIYSTDEEAYEQVRQAVIQYPDIYIGMGGVDLTKGVKRAFLAMERFYNEWGFHGFGINPYLSGVFANDRRYYPFYALTESLGKTVYIHSSIHYNPWVPMEIGNPKYVDEVAVDFPDLKIVVGHAGRGFGMSAVWAADRHKNVYFDVSFIHPRYIDPEVLHAMNSFVKHKALYAAGTPALPWSIHDEWRRLIQEGNHERFFWKNAARAFNLNLDAAAAVKEKPAEKPAGKSGKKKK